MSKQGQDSLINRLRGLYKVGPDGEYGVRDFSGSMPPICKEAADRIEALEEALREAVEVIYYADGMVGIIRDLADCPGKAEALAKRIKKASENKILTQLLTTKEDNNK